MSQEKEAKRRQKEIKTICKLLVYKRNEPKKPYEAPDRGEFHFIPSKQAPEEKIAVYIVKTDNPLPGNPILLFTHGDGESIDDYKLDDYFVPNGMNFCVMDYRGTGCSDGEYVTLGIKETDDTITVINFLKENGYNKISFFGRSLGGEIGVHIGALFPEIVCIALDSPCVSIKDLVIYQASKFKKIDKERAKELYEEACKLAKEIYNVDFFGNEAIDMADKIKQPFFLIHGKRDIHVPISHSERLFEKISSKEKKFIPFNGTHNDISRFKYFDEQFLFILQKNGSDVTDFY